MSRRMCIIRRADGTLLFYNAMPLDEKALEEVKAWGKPAILLVAHDQHMIDARPFAEKLELKVFGPKECEAKIRARIELSGTLEDVPSDPAIQIETAAGAKTGEPVLAVTSAGGRVSLLCSDVLMNARPQSMGLFPRLLGFSGPLKVVPIFRMFLLKDKKALKAQIQRWSELPGLERVVPFHGDIITSGVSQALRAASAPL
jgi:hypothetical protein